MTSTPTVTVSAAEAHLPDASMAKFRELLVTERTAEAVQLSEHQRTVADLTGQTDVDSILEREVAEAAARRSGSEIADIDRALALLDAGTYGACEHCGSSIARERLEAIPQARLCVGCSRSRTRLLD